MAYSEGEKKAFRKRCQKNYHVFNGKIKKLEKRAKQIDEPHKLLAEIKIIQQDLKAKQEGKKSTIDFFGSGADSTRAKFQRRLSSLFKAATNKNKDNLKKHLVKIDRQVSQGDCKFSELQLLNQMLTALPFKDADRNKLKGEIDALFAKWRSRVEDPEVNKKISDLEKSFKDAQKQMQGLASMSFVIPSFSSNWQKMITIHKGLKGVQRQITQTQKFMNGRSLGQKKKNQLYARINKIWKDNIRCWNNKGLAKVSTWIEELTASNFQYFDIQLQQLESDAEINPGRQKIQFLQQKIKNIEDGMKATDAEANPLHPLKRSAWAELFARTWSLRQHLQHLWNKTPPVSSKEFKQLKNEVESVIAQLSIASTVDAMYQVCNQAKELHKKRKEFFMQHKKLTAPENGRLTRMINRLYEDAYNLIHIARPKQFSLEWLSEAYNKNRQNGWVVFVDDVPVIR